jgi:hypothetical protein
MIQKPPPPALPLPLLLQQQQRQQKHLLLNCAKRKRLTYTNTYSLFLIYDIRFETSDVHLL